MAESHGQGRAGAAADTPSLQDRASPEALEDQLRAVEENPVIHTILHAFQGVVLILNEQRQIVAANAAMLESRGLAPEEGFVGLRPGEAFGCLHSTEGKDGCGTATACAHCGALHTFLASRKSDAPERGTCSLAIRTPEGEEALEFSILASPLDLGPHRFTVVSLQDVSDQKRRELLERVFFHDVLNTVGSLQGWAGLLPNLDPDRKEHATTRIQRLGRRLLQEIRAQQAIALAEADEIAPAWEPVDPSSLLLELRDDLSEDPCAEGKLLDVGLPSEAPDLVTDRGLLIRVLGNMLRNAYEASKPGEEVRLSLEVTNGGLRFSVHNPAWMPPEIAGQVFKRSFSTKSRHGRGIGTYSMKLLGERCLGGTVAFDTSEKTGTTFWIDLPLQPDKNAAAPALVSLEPATQEDIDEITATARAVTATKRDRASPGRRLKGTRILVVDDVTPMRHMIVSALESESAATTEAGNGLQAVDLVRSAAEGGLAYHLVLLDLFMPRKNGAQVLREIRAAPETEATPVVILTSDRDKKSVLQCVELGIDGYLLKPPDKDRLLSLVLHCLDRTEARRDRGQKP